MPIGAFIKLKHIAFSVELILSRERKMMRRKKFVSKHYLLINEQSKHMV